MIEILTHPYTVLLMRWLVAIILIVAGIGKLFDHEAFMNAVTTYDILPAPFSQLYALGLPWIELFLGLLLLLGLLTRISAFLVALLFCSFIVAIGITIVRRKHLDCHCFGNFGQEKVGVSTLLRNLCFLVLTLLIINFYDGYLSIEGWLLDWPQRKTETTDELIPLILLVLLLGTAFFIIRQVFLTTLKIKNKT